jgi:hypothetical protein
MTGNVIPPYDRTKDPVWLHFAAHDKWQTTAECEKPSCKAYTAAKADGSIWRKGGEARGPEPETEDVGTAGLL